jgi:hypothetical protein
MVLFSMVDGAPLASLHLRCQDTNVDMGRALITKRPAKSGFNCDFQGILNKDGQEFEFVITNLCQDGNINFNIMKTDEKVQMVNPGGINEINELRPFESYAVKCDQADNMSLVLNSIKQSVKQEDGTVKEVKLTVGDAEASTDVKPQGTYYFLSVVPQIGKPEMINQFKSTNWACVDVFVVREKEVAPPYGQFEFHFDRGTSFGSNRRVMDSLPYQPYRSAVPTTFSRTAESFGTLGIPEHGYTNCSSSGPMMTSNVSLAGSSMPEPLMACADESSEGELELDLFDGVIKDSYAATVTGKRKIEVHSAQTGIEYEYEACSTPCLLGLSISDKLIFKPTATTSDIVKQGVEMIQDIIKNKSFEMLAKIAKVYASEECIVCLEKDVDTVFYQCGHQCCHYKCGEALNKCPLCRNHIAGMIKL